MSIKPDPNYYCFNHYYYCCR